MKKRKHKEKPIIKILSSEIYPDMLNITLYIPRIPSANIRLILHKYNRRFILNNEYRTFKTALQNIFSQFKLYGNSFSLHIIANRIIKNQKIKIDADNLLKILLDSISVVIGDDNLIKKIYIEKNYILYSEIKDAEIVSLISNNKYEKGKKSFGYILKIQLNKIE